MKLVILDGNSIMNRAYYGVRPLTAPDGTPTNAVYGFLATLSNIVDEEAPDSLCVAFDLPAPTFRHEMYEGYKAQRKPMPDDLAIQMPVLKEVLDAMGIKRIEVAGYEADDVLGAVGKKCGIGNLECVIVTGDKDSFQLITDKTHIRHVRTKFGQTETTEYDIPRFEEEYGFAPPLMVDLKALMGDTSDNIPGVKGIGEKTALDLVRRFGTIEAIYNKLPELDIKESVRKKLEDGAKSARMSYELATIDTGAPVDLKPEEAVFRGFSGTALYDVLHRLGFNRFIERWNLSPGEDTVEKSASEALPYKDGADTETIMAAIKKAGYISVMTRDDLDSLEICDGKNIYSVGWTGLEGGYNELLGYVFSEEVKKVSHNVKDFMSILLGEGLSAGGFVFDTALAAYLLDPTETNYELKRLAPRFLGREAPDAQAVYELYPALREKLEEIGAEKLFFEIELPLCEVLAEMEKTGFLVDRKALFEYGESLKEGIDKLQAEIWRQAGMEFNINSPKQLGEVLFDRLMLPTGKKTKTGWSTNADELEKLRGKHQIIQNILDYRELSKLKSTYADGLLKVISPDGRIHTNFRMTVTATGRLSSTEPNLQNIPIRKELGSEIRKMFVAAPGMKLVDADYSQIELRLLAHISGDETMKKAFMDGEDIHSVTASQVFNVPFNEVTSLQRSRAKAVNFGIVYGISAFALAQDIGVWQSEAKEYIDAYLAKYHGVRDYMKKVVEDAKRDGYVKTLYGRRRQLPELKSPNFNTRNFGERVALNMPIQGTAADIMKLAMVNVSKRLKAEGLKAKLILQVHDELIAECPEAEAEITARILDEEMEAAAKLSVPLTAEAGIGRSWAEAH
ncbi:MAG: DNA polymerase I [Clostridia bacterium]|nr:DNA polymerase I [Clostridia bacterium]